MRSLDNVPGERPQNVPWREEAGPAGLNTVTRAAFAGSHTRMEATPCSKKPIQAMQITKLTVCFYVGLLKETLEERRCASQDSPKS